jgi:hypothetical protein
MFTYSTLDCFISNHNHHHASGHDRRHPRAAGFALWVNSEGAPVQAEQVGAFDPLHNLHAEQELDWV